MTKFELLVNEVAQKSFKEWHQGHDRMSTAAMINYVENRIDGFTRTQIRTAVYRAIRVLMRDGQIWVDGFNGKNRVS
ncbi:hypothetical protein HPQ32_14110 [Photobacterium carnosum]|uniref:hypothetical protein n=1 Tax=Photobacterium carnosum TaxID=2023717 RepID=UPI001C919247|nr:hypothetical protein [Photobacterium carnosum]MBY3789557.1 hypothetical protein [Photobacterium carnosum]MCD9534616.1 hypothetical protein [Photobacterium carnosum]